MGHSPDWKKEYLAYAKRLGRGSHVLKVPRSETALQGYWEMLKIVATPEDAALAALLPGRPTALTKLSEQLKMPVASLSVRLQNMADKGLVMDFIHPETGEAYYLLAPPIVGFIEFSMMRTKESMPRQSEMAVAADKYLNGDEVFYRDLSGGPTSLGRAVVYEDTLSEEALPEVLNWQKSNEIIEDATTIAVSLCCCRHKASHLGKACDAPQDNCITLNSAADYVIRHGFGRRIEKKDAFDILETGKKLGLVRIADNVQRKPIFLCNCCGCCCVVLEGTQKYGLPAVNPSGFVPTIKQEKCNGCALCAKACPISAIELHPERKTGIGENLMYPSINEDRCIGCGVCATACKKNAVTMVSGGKPRHVPITRIEHLVRTAIERNRLADLLVDEGNSLGGRIVHRIVEALLKLPPAQALFANEQIRSRFVNIVVERELDPTLWKPYKR